MVSVPAPAAQSRENLELISDLCRFAEGLVTEAAVRKRWRLEEKDWIALNDDEVVRAVDEERVRRIRSGAAKREKAQQHLVKGPDILNTIMSDPRANARHKIDAVKALNDLSDFSPQVARDVDRVVIHIDMGADTRLKGGKSNPADILEIEAEVRPRDADGKIIDATPRERPPMIEASEQFDQEVVPLKRGRGRPRGSKSKPKLVEPEPKPQGVPGFNLD